MSAICGVVHRGGRVLQPDVLDPMMAQLAIYGPDGSGRWASGAVALGHHHLRVTPESAHATLPLRTDGVVLVSDVRLDNRRELLSALGVPRGQGQRTPDEALLLRAYGRWGEASVDHLLGDFAFALWDEEAERLFCVRDSMGMRPLYYHVGRDVVAFATDQRALLRLPGVRHDLDEVALADHLAGNWSADPTATLFSDLRRLPPAHTLTVHRGDVSVRRYWTPDLGREIRFGRDEEYVEAYWELFTQAVRDRLRTGHGVAAFLSGGLDSSTIACMAAGELAARGRPPLHTYSNVLAPGSDWPPGDEREVVEAILARQPHIRGRFVTDDGKSLVGSVLESRGDPSLPGQGTDFLTEAVDAARASGVRVLFDGYGGDQAATARGGFALDELLGRGRWMRLLRLAHDRSALSGTPAWRIVAATARRVVRDRAPESLARMGRPDPLEEGRRKASSFVSPALAERVGLAERLRMGAGSGTDRFRRLRDVQWYFLSVRAPERVVERTHSLFAARHVQRVLPFLDRRLVEYCLSVPCEQHAAGPGRALVRRAARGTVPDEVLDRADKAYAAIPAMPRYLTGDRERIREVLDAVGRSPLVRNAIDIDRLRAVLLVDLPPTGLRRTQAEVDQNAAQRAFRTAYLLAWLEDGGDAG